MTAHSDDTVESAGTAPNERTGETPGASERSSPRRVALLSDVHGNLPALEAVMEAIQDWRADQVWCLGDLVGYGAQPDECVARAREACDACLVGNHDLVVLDRLDISAFSAGAAAAARWTRERLGREAAEFLGTLSPADIDRPIGLYHASPRDPVWEYVLSLEAAEGSMRVMEPRVGAIGHSHVALCFGLPDGGRVGGEPAPADATADIREGSWLLNPGAVGQPRDGDPRAAWLELDLEAWTATWRRTEYPIDQAADAIRAAGLPAMLADRLYLGQ